ncbi:MAG: hypothetical protein ACO1RX_15870 [Candidatus Sericytochromatia bacterium]
MHVLFYALLVVLAGSLTPSAQACELLKADTLTRLAKVATPLTQTSQVPDRCHYEWPKANTEAVSEQNAEALRDSMRRGGEAYTPQSTWNTVALEVLQSHANPNLARTAFEQAVAGRIPERYGSPDPLAGTQFERVSLPQGAAAWDKTRNQLLLLKGAQVLLFSVEVETDPAKNKALALQLAAALMGS